jgi:thioredoxin-related protein
MRKPVIIIVVLFIASLLLINGFKGESPSGGDWNAAINWTDAAITNDDIKSSGKPVYLFVSTEWCTYCKKMKGGTFSDAKVQKLLNELFVSITINPETPGTANFTGEELTFAELAQKLRVTGYPASFFFDEQGQLIGGQPGYIKADAFAELAEFVGDGHYKQRSYSEFQSLPADQRRP